MRIRALLLLSAMAVLADGATAASKWLRVKTPHFTVMGDASERSLSQVALRFEQFREVFVRLFPNAQHSTGAPVLVVVFGSGRAYEPFMPIHNGRRVDVGGMFIGRPGASYITMSSDRRENAYPIVFHEYIHLLVRSTLADVPVWFNEGLAEYYSTFEMAADREAAIGKVQAEHVYELRERFLPMAQLITVGHDSPLYNEGTRRSIFYAQSWAFVHYLLLGNAARKPQLPIFLEKHAKGVPTAQAFKEAFGVDETTMERELRQYVQRSAYQSQLITFTEKLDFERNFVVEPMSAADAEAAMADLLLQMDRLEDAGRRAEGALKLTPAHARALAVLGRVRLRSGAEADGRALLEQATANAPDDYLPHYYRALALLRPDAEKGAVAPDAASARRAVPLLEKAVALQPDHADVQCLLGFGRLLLGNAAGAIQPLAAAFKLVPRHEYALLYAQAQVNTRDYAAVRPLLTSLAERGSSEGIRLGATELLKRVTLLERGSRAPSTVAPSETRAPNPGKPLDAPAEAAPRFLPVLRALNNGETRVEGTLQSIDCTPGRVVLRVQTAEGSLALDAARVDDIEFISYRDDLRGEVKCGIRRPPDPVHATWKAVAGRSDKRAVAIEFMPDEPRR